MKPNIKLTVGFSIIYLYVLNTNSIFSIVAPCIYKQTVAYIHTVALLIIIILDERRSSCGEGEFDCGNGRCIPDSKRCDGKGFDCWGNADEKNCGELVHCTYAW